MNAHAYALIQTHGVKAVTKARIEREGGREIEGGREGGSARGRRICCISCMSRQNDRCSSSLMSNGTLVYKYNIQRLHSQHKPQRPPLPSPPPHPTQATQPPGNDRNCTATATGIHPRITPCTLPLFPCRTQRPPCSRACRSI